MTFTHTFVYIDLFLNLLLLIQCNGEYVPALIWSSSGFNNRKYAEDLVLNKIRSDLFESYILEVIGNKNPIISVFLEERLGSSDFEWKGETNFKSYPHLSNLSVNSRVDYFRYVENPHKILAKLSKKLYKLNQDKEIFEEVDSDLLLLEFKEIQSDRSEILKSHDEIMKNVSQRIEESGRDWICVYTGRHSNQKEVMTEIKEISSWHVDHPFSEMSNKVISIYEDRLTKFALVTRGSIQLLLPSPKNLAYRSLEDYSKIEIIKKETKMDFVIWFLNYTLTLNLKKPDMEWIIESGKIVNENGDSLNLYPSSASLNKEEPPLEFQSQGKPFVKIKLNKYKFLTIQYFKEPCDNTYRFQITALLTSIILTMGLFLWYSIIKNLDFSVKSRIVNIPLETLMSSKFEDF